VLLLPIAIALLVSIHLAIIARQKHTQFPGRGRTERNVVGTPLWPAYALRSTALLLAVTAVVFLLGGLVQINPIWLWGPYHTYEATNGAQPDWYLGWLIGGLRLMPPLELHVLGYTIVRNPFFDGALFPLVVFGLLYASPAIERRITGDRARHELLDRPRDVPWRTAVGAAFFTWVAVIFVAGSADQISVHFQIPYVQQLWFFRIAVFVAPALVYTRRVCEELLARARGWRASSASSPKALACDADNRGRAGFAGAAVLALACDADNRGRAGFAGAAVLAGREPRNDLALVEAQEAVLVRPDLVDVDVVEAGVPRRRGSLEMPLRIGAADDGRGDIVLGDELGGGLVVGPGRELLAERAAQAGVRPDLVHRLARLLLALAAEVAAAWATIAGWIRIVGQVTPVPSRSRCVACAIPPITLQTNGLWPCLSIHGW